MTTYIILIPPIDCIVRISYEPYGLLNGDIHYSVI